nr:unnamed protein product [Digitaria exilis]
MSNSLLRVSPSDLKMPFELKKQNSACLELYNKTDQHVAFKVKTTNPRKYAVRPASGVVPPRGSFCVTITMQAPKEIPPDYHCKDKFLVQSIVVEEGTTVKDIVPNMFSKAPGKLVEDFKLRVIYIPANPPSPVPEETEEEDSLDSDVDHEVERPSTSDPVSSNFTDCCFEQIMLCLFPDVSQVSMSGDQESRYAEENKKIQKELIVSSNIVYQLSVLSGRHLDQSSAAAAWDWRAVCGYLPDVSFFVDTSLSADKPETARLVARHARSQIAVIPSFPQLTGRLAAPRN